MMNFPFGAVKGPFFRGNSWKLYLDWTMMNFLFGAVKGPGQAIPSQLHSRVKSRVKKKRYPQRMVKSDLMFQGLWKPHWFTWQKGRNFKSLFRWGLGCYVALGRGRFVGWVSAMMVGFKLMRFPAAIFFEAKKNHGLRTPFRPEVAWREIFLGQPTKSRTQQWWG